MRSFLGIFLPLFCVVDLETINFFMPATGELIMLNRLLIVPCIECAMLNIEVNLFLLVLRHRGSMVLHESRIMTHQEYSEHSTCSHKYWETLKGTIMV